MQDRSLNSISLWNLAKMCIRDRLRYIIAIADTGSMNEAAKSLFISQPSLSLAVKELEKDVYKRQSIDTAKSEVQRLIA